MFYSIMNAYAIDKDSGQFKAPFNTIANEPKVYTPADTAVVTPNSDTPYSFVFMDLRAEPVVLCVPEIEKDRYYSVFEGCHRSGKANLGRFWLRSSLQMETQSRRCQGR